MNKQELRKRCFALLRGLSEEEKEIFSGKICRNLAALSAFQDAEVVLSYMAFGNEPDLSALMWAGPGSEKTWGFSVVEADNTLSFRKVDSPEKQLKEGGFGFLEPVADLCPEIDPAKVDVVLIPGVGFDPETGARLGRGKGHYDRFLASLLSQEKPGFSPLLIGVAFSIQLCPLNPEPHDVSMDGVITEVGFAEAFS